MALLPDTVVGKIQYCEDHIPPFTANAVAIGTTAGAVTDLDTKTQAARAAYDAQQAAKQAAKAATNALREALEPMVDAMADILKQVKAKAAVSGGSVYTLAQVDPPLPPSPITTLGTPTDFIVMLDGSGTVQLKWKCTNPRGATGTIYQVWRRTSPTGEFTYIGGNGSKKFTDTTLPAGSTHVTYQVQAVRSTATGPFAQFNVNFGVGAGGIVTATVEPATTKIAA